MVVVLVEPVNKESDQSKHLWLSIHGVSDEDMHTHHTQTVSMTAHTHHKLCQ
jgi:hypothetical protein